MGILKAIKNAAGGTLADQWKEYFPPVSMGTGTLILRGRPQRSNRGSNTRGSRDAITDGSIICVSEGQAALVVDGGKTAAVCTEPGEHEFHCEASPTVLNGQLNQVLTDVWRRVSFGDGEAPVFQRVYYVNMKEIPGNMFYANGIPVRLVLPKTSLDLEGGLNCSGSYSFRVVDPALFFHTACETGISEPYTSISFERVLRPEVQKAVLYAAVKLTESGVQPSAMNDLIPILEDLVRNAVNEVLVERRGVEICSLTLYSARLDDNTQWLVREQERAAALRDPAAAAAAMAAIRAKAQQTVRPKGPMTLMDMPGAAGFSRKKHWRCRSCGKINTAKFCEDCGAPATLPEYRCSACGFVPADPQNPPKFCPSCGDPMDEFDLVPAE